MGISMITAVEIYTNPKDLEFRIGQERHDGLFAFTVTRGPGHDFRLLLSTRPFAQTEEEIIDAIGEILVGIHESAPKELEGMSNRLGFLCSDQTAVDSTNVLSPELITRILEELRQHQVASTYKM